MFSDAGDSVGNFREAFVEMTRTEAESSSHHATAQIAGSKPPPHPDNARVLTVRFCIGWQGGWGEGGGVQMPPLGYWWRTSIT